MSSKMALIAFILVMSVLFPAAGYFMDYMRYRKYRTIDPNDVNNTILNEDSTNSKNGDLELEKN